MALDDRGGEERQIERRLRTLGSACAVVAAAVLVTAGTIGWAAGRAGADALMTSPPADSFLIAVGAMLLVLLASAVHRRILRQPASDLDGDPAGELDDDPGGEPDGDRGGEPVGEPNAPVHRWPPRPSRAPAAVRLRAYSWATGVSFGMLAAAAALGAVVALGGKALFYGLVICLAALIAMVARWPRRSGFDLFDMADRGERSEP
ncbi:MAG TPA: hypothetical protein VHG32_13975 [Thermoanaerobaculia bacterium]|nr:hypothetical protein [Thermoanaerobaculia bacterium]